jgi:Tol biopolymer transport system component
VQVSVCANTRPQRRKLATSKGAVNPIWSPDGKRIAYSFADSTGTNNLFGIAADGSGREELLFASKYPKWTTDI